MVTLLNEDINKAMIVQRSSEGPLARFLDGTLPPDPQPVFVWPQLVARVASTKLPMRKLTLVAIGLVAVTLGTITLLLQVPFLDWSVVNFLTQGFDTILPHAVAIALAWVVGIGAVMSLGGFATHNWLQARLHALTPTKNKVFNFILSAALIEEQLFRSGSEKWSWTQRIRASLLFGAVHITNIWYSMAAGISLGLTGLGFLLVYLWYYKRHENQIIATAASTTVHAIYNTALLALLVVTLIGWAALSLIF